MASVVLAKTLATAAGVDGGDLGVSVSGSTVGAVLDGLCARHESLRAHLLNASGKVKGHVLLVLGGEKVTESMPIGESDELRILLATAGGLGCR